MTRQQSFLVAAIMIVGGIGLTVATGGRTIFYGLVVVGLYRLVRTLMTPE